MHGGVLITWGPLGPITSHWRLISDTIYPGSSILNPIGLSDRPKDNEEQISFDHLDIGLPKALLLSGREGRLSMLFRRWLQDVLDVWLDKNLNCAFQKNIQLPLSQRRHSSSSSQLSVMQKPQKMQTQLCCFTHSPLQQDLKTEAFAQGSSNSGGEPMLNQEFKFSFSVLTDFSVHFDCGWNKGNPRLSNTYALLHLVSNCACGFLFFLCTSKKASGAVSSVPFLCWTSPAPSASPSTESPSPDHLSGLCWTLLDLIQ